MIAATSGVLFSSKVPSLTLLIPALLSTSEMRLMSLFFQQSTVMSLAFTPAFKSSLACETTAPAISSSLSTRK